MTSETHRYQSADYNGLNNTAKSYRWVIQIILQLCFVSLSPLCSHNWAVYFEWVINKLQTVINRVCEQF